MIVNHKDVGAYLDAFVIGSGHAVAADGVLDDVKVTGATMNLAACKASSGKLIVVYATTLTAAKTLTFAIEYQDSADGSNWDTAVDVQTATIAETGALTAETGTVEYDVSLAGAKQYRRYNITPNLSHSGTDTVDWGAVFVALADA